MTTSHAAGAALPEESRLLTRLPQPPQPPQRIASEAEALETAHRLAAQFHAGAATRDHERRLPWDEIEQYSASGLGTITVPQAYGGLGASY